MAETSKTRKRLAEVMATPEFQMLTEKQQAFCAKYLSGGLLDHYDAEAAVRAVYAVASPKNAKILSYELLANPKIKKVLDLHFNRTEPDVFLAELEQTIRRSKGIAKVKAQELYARMKFGVSADDENSTPDEDSTTFVVGQLVTQRDGDGVLHTGRVVELDGAGRPARIETVA
jgi:hypothetical protein